MVDDGDVMKIKGGEVRFVQKLAGAIHDAYWQH
jgi:hypothetical protein